MNTIVNIGDKVIFTNREIITSDDNHTELLEIGKIYTVKTLVEHEYNGAITGYRGVHLEEIPHIMYNQVLFKHVDNKREFKIITIYNNFYYGDRIDFQIYYDGNLMSDTIFRCDIFDIRKYLNSDAVIRVEYPFHACIINKKGNHFPYKGWDVRQNMCVIDNVYLQWGDNKHHGIINCLDTGEEIAKFCYPVNTGKRKNNVVYGEIYHQSTFGTGNEVKFTLNTITKEITYI